MFLKIKGILSLKNFIKKISGNYGRGFTLIEMMVSIGIFSVLMGVLSGIFLASMKSQTHIVYTQYLIDSSNFALDYMSRYLRMAQKDYSGACLGDISRAGDNFYPSNPPDSPSSTITFLDYKAGGGKCHQFLLENGKIKEKISTDSTSAGFASVTAQDLTSDKINVTDLKFNVLGGANYDLLQPRVTISIKAEAKTENLNPLPNINVQTTISQRNLDKEI